MAAAMAGDLVAFHAGGPELAQPLHDVVFRFGITDIGSSGRMARRIVKGAIGAGQQIDAGQEIGELRPGFARERAAALPLLDMLRAVEGDDDIL
jgi:hypothetical protein